MRKLGSTAIKFPTEKELELSEIKNKKRKGMKCFEYKGHFIWALNYKNFKRKLSKIYGWKEK